MSFFRVAAGVPACAVAHPKVNAERIIELAKSAHKGGYMCSRFQSFVSLVIPREIS